MRRVELVEHWWNGVWGMAQLDVYLEREGRRWRVRALERKDEKTERLYADMTEPQARAYLRYLIRTAAAPSDGWAWRDIAAAHRRTR